MNPLSLLDGPMSGSSSAGRGMGPVGYSNQPVTTSTATGQATTNANFSSGSFVLGGGTAAPAGASNMTIAMLAGGALLALYLWTKK